jgi:hypothetical protein
VLTQAPPVAARTSFIEEFYRTAGSRRPHHIYRYPACPPPRASKRQSSRPLQCEHAKARHPSVDEFPAARCQPPSRRHLNFRPQRFLVNSPTGRTCHKSKGCCRALSSPPHLPSRSPFPYTSRNSLCTTWNHRPLRSTQHQLTTFAWTRIRTNDLPLGPGPREDRHL